MKLFTGLLTAGCAAGAAVLTVFGRKSVERAGASPLELAIINRKLDEEFQLLNGRIQELAQDPNAGVDDLMELQPICLRYDLAQRDADPYGRVPENGMTAILMLAVVAKTIQKVVS